MSGATIGGALGAVAAAFIPGIGWQLGWTVGSLIGGYIDPQTAKGSRLQEATRQTAQEGVFIPFGFGAFVVPGQLLWAADPVEHEEDQGGKGSSGPAAYSYTVSYAIGICEGPIAGLLMIKRNGKIVYDIRPDADSQAENSKFLEKCTIYLGDETQNVDPTIESYVGVGNSGPMRGLAYIVVTDDETLEGEVAQYEFVVQVCGAVETTVAENFLATGPVSKVRKSKTGETWTDRTTGLTGVTLKNVCSIGDYVAGHDSSGNFYRSTDRGSSWVPATSGAFSGAGEMTAGGGRMVCLRTVAGVVSTLISTDYGDNWTAGGTIATTTANGICYGSGHYVFVSGNTNGGIYSSPDASTWTLQVSGDYTAVGFNGLKFLAGLNTGGGFKVSSGGLSWSNAGGSMSHAPVSIVGGAGYFCVGTFEDGIYRTTDDGSSFTQVLVTAVGRFYSAAVSVDGDVVFGSGGGGSNVQYYSTNSGVSFTQISPAINDQDIIYLGPSSNLMPVPDAPGVYTDEDGNLVTDYIDTTVLDSCTETLENILKNVCERDGIDPDEEVDASALAGVAVTGFRCMREAGAEGFIEELSKAFFFDRGEWDKKLRFVPRGASATVSLTTDDLTAQEGDPIEFTDLQEAELLRKVSVLTIDPDADYNPGKQSWSRRVSTIAAKGEQIEDLTSITAGADECAQIAERRGKAGWGESEKLKFGLTVKHSYLVPTDVVALTDADGDSHELRFSEVVEDAGQFRIDEAVRTGSALYVPTATGEPNPNGGGANAPGMVGPTIFTAMNLPQLRPQDGAGMYVGAAGVLPGWVGCQIWMSVDGGVSYTLAMSITRPTKIGLLTSDVTSSGEPLQVHIYGGLLSSKTTAQVALGANWAAVAATDGTPEVLSYEDATATATRYFDLETLTRGLMDTTAAAHATGDYFLDLATCYFIPIDPAYAGTIYFKAVGIGVSADAVDAVAYTYDPAEVVIDGGEIT